MITVKTIHGETVLKPTIFPDGTSQIWKLPEGVLGRREYLITWHFEQEREIIDLYSLKSLILMADGSRDAYIHLHLPYLPYGRQDKNVQNDLTFNLVVFARLINNLELDKVTTVDAHSDICRLINNIENLSVAGFHEQVILEFGPTFLVFPDKGAMARYGKGLSHVRAITCDKVRDQKTGDIISFKANLPTDSVIENDNLLLIVDDICDGGATFIAVAKAIRDANPGLDLVIGLCVTHGVFSKGKQHLLDNGINWIYTTDSLPRNKGAYKV
jgi:ribose-phosphate pyrophosphokinase